MIECAKKDHKYGFKTSPFFRLLNPSESELVRVSKKILQDICDILYIDVNINQ